LPGGALGAFLQVSFWPWQLIAFTLKSLIQKSTLRNMGSTPLEWAMTAERSFTILRED
jgi:hypothetical protein